MLASSENELTPHVLHSVAASAYVPATLWLQLECKVGGKDEGGGGRGSKWTHERADRERLRETETHTHTHTHAIIYT